MANINIKELIIPTGESHPTGSSFDVSALINNRATIKGFGDSACHFTVEGILGDDRRVDGHRYDLELEVIGEGGSVVHEDAKRNQCAPIEGEDYDMTKTFEVPMQEPGLYDIVLTCIPLPTNTGSPNTADASIEILSTGSSGSGDSGGGDSGGGGSSGGDDGDNGGDGGGTNFTTFVMEDPALALALGVGGVVAVRTVIDQLLPGE